MDAASRSYRLTRNFAVGALIVVALAAVSLAEVNRSSAVAQLQRMADRNNAALTQVFANGVWARFSAFIRDAYRLSADEIRAHPETASLNQTIAQMMAGTRVLKVKLYDLRGFTVFSTAPEQIGGDYSRNPRFLGALDGRSVAELEFRDSFGAIDGPRTDVWVLSSYIPVRPAGAGGMIGGVAEIYSDVTDIHAYVAAQERQLLSITGAAFLLVFLLLVAIVAYAERQMRRIHRRNLELAASYARAEAASKSKSTFLANISHELRTPLNAIIGFAEMISGAVFGPLGSEKYREFARDIESSGKHLMKIINDVLDLVNAETGEMAVASEPFDAAAAVREVAKLLEHRARNAKVDLQADTGGAPLAIEGDEAKIRQILINLATNAIDFTPAGGTATLAVRRLHGLGRIEFAVSDSGIGMAPEEIAKALAPFSQVDDSLARKREGTGLGLTLSKKFAELLDGTLEIESRPGVGTRVTVVIPERVAAKSPARARSAA